MFDEAWWRTKRRRYNLCFPIVHNLVGGIYNNVNLRQTEISMTLKCHWSLIKKEVILMRVTCFINGARWRMPGKLEDTGEAASLLLGKQVKGDGCEEILFARE